MTTTAADTKRDLARMRAHVRGVNADIMVGVTQDAYESITVGHPLTGAPGQPVDTGYLRNSWSLFTDAPTFRSAGDGKDNSGTSEQPLNEPQADPAVLIRLAMGQSHVVTIGTNTAYAEHQEFHHESKAGSVRLTENGIPALAAKAFRQANAARAR